MKIKKLIYVLVGTLVVASLLLRHGAWEWKRRDGDRTGSKFSFG